MIQTIFNTSWKSFDEDEYIKQLNETHYIPVRQHPTEYELRKKFPSLDNIAEYGSLDAYSEAVELWVEANPLPEDKPYSTALLLLAGHVDELLDETVASYADWRQKEVTRAKYSGLENCWQPHQIMADRITEKPTEIYDLLRHALAVSKPLYDNTDPKLDVKWFHYEARIKDLTTRLDRYCHDMGLEVPDSDFYLALRGSISPDSAQPEKQPSLRDTLSANAEKAAEHSTGMPTQSRQKSENALGA